jgi:hypothetical protein
VAIEHSADLAAAVLSFGKLLGDHERARRDDLHILLQEPLDVVSPSFKPASASPIISTGDEGI